MYVAPAPSAALKMPVHMLILALHIDVDMGAGGRASEQHDLDVGHLLCQDYVCKKKNGRRHIFFFEQTSVPTQGHTRHMKYLLAHTLRGMKRKRQRQARVLKKKTHRGGR